MCKGRDEEKRLKRERFIAAAGLIVAIFAVPFIPLVYLIVFAGSLLYVVITFGSLLWTILELGKSKSWDRKKFIRDTDRINKEREERRLNHFQGGNADLDNKETEIRRWWQDRNANHEDKIEGMMKKGCTRLLKGMVVLLFVCILNTEEKNEAWAAMYKVVDVAIESFGGLFHTPQNDFENETESFAVPEEKPKMPDLAGGTVGNAFVEEECKFVNWKYFLQSPQTGKYLSEGKRKEIFYSGYENIQQAVNKRLDMLLGFGWTDENVAGAKDSQNRDADSISMKQNEINNQSKAAREASTWKEWRANVPDISMLEDIITGREELLEKCKSRRLNFLLANDYQAYAQEYYYREDGNAECILYYYSQSIYYAEQALKYADSAENPEDFKQMVIRYIAARYKDIAECDSIIRLFDDMGWDNPAEEIYMSVEAYAREYLIQDGTS